MSTKPSQLETKHLVSAGLGMLCPVPLVGEAMLAYGIYPVIKETGLFGRDEVLNSITSLAVAGLARFELYKPVYLPILEWASQFIK